MPRLCRPVLALAVVPLVVLIGFQSAWAALACAGGGSGRDHCCCVSDQDQPRRDPADGAQRFQRQDCCQASPHDALSAPAVREVERTAFDFTAAIVTVTPIALAPLRCERRWAVAEMARPPPSRVPLYIDKQALLR